MRKLIHIIIASLLIPVISFAVVTNTQKFTPWTNGITSTFYLDGNSCAVWEEDRFGYVNKTGTTISGKVTSRYINEYGDELTAIVDYADNCVKNNLVNWKTADGRILKTEKYKKGKKHGRQVWYSKNGKVRKERMFKEGVLDGAYRFFGETGGRLQGEIIYKNGRIIKQSRYYPSGALQMVEIYDERKCHRTEIDGDGRIVSKQEIDLEAGNNPADTAMYHPSSLNPEAETTPEYNYSFPDKVYFSAGKPCMVESYFQDGKIKTKGVYEGKKIHITVFDDSGRIKEQGLKSENPVNPQMAQKCGLWKEYYEDGKIAAKGYYGTVNGDTKMTDLKCGKWILYTPDGKLKVEDYGNAGLILGKETIGRFLIKLEIVLDSVLSYFNKKDAGSVIKA